MTVEAVKRRTDEDTGRGADVRQIETSPAARSQCTLRRIDYEDTFLVATTSIADRTAAQWARSVLEGATASTRRALRTGWTALGLRLGPTDAADHVLGWPVRRSSPDQLLLGADGRFGLSGQLLFERTPDGLLFATFVHLDNPVAKAVWAGVTPTHQRTVRRLLTSVANETPAT